MVKIGLAIQTAEAKIRAIAQVADAMRSEYQAALAEESTLATELNAQKQEAQGLNRAGIEYGVLQRDSTANRQMFEALLQRSQETGVSEEIRTGNIRIVDVAIGLAFAFEYADDRIKNPDEMKKHPGCRSSAWFRPCSTRA